MSQSILLWLNGLTSDKNDKCLLVRALMLHLITEFVFYFLLYFITVLIKRRNSCYMCVKQLNNLILIDCIV
jgi:hypothetical protein